jgi:predicted AAA+ superfamily ATPase
VDGGYLPRLVDGLISDLLTELPALLLVGPRACGKTTTAARHARSVLRLDEPAVANVVTADPDAALRGLAEPVLVDEWQLAPSVLGAIKRAVDALDGGRRPGRFIVTGSVHADLDHQTWPGTGRLVRVGVTGLTVRELIRADLGRPPFLDLVANEGAAGLRLPAVVPDLRDYVEMALRGGFPEVALGLSARALRGWSRSYLDQLFTRDVDYAGAIRRDPERLRRYFSACALNTAGVAAHQTLFEAAGIDRKTADAYDRLLHNLYVLDSVPPWSSNRLKRLTRSPKRFVVDSGLAAGALRLGVDGFMRDGDLLGRLLETFVAAQLRAELQLGCQEATLYHVRDQNGEHEVDLLAELDVNRVIGVEVKATSVPNVESARHLLWLRDQLGTRFVAGVVLHTGPGVFALAEGIVAAPICTLWG